MTSKCHDDPVTYQTRTWSYCEGNTSVLEISRMKWNVPFNWSEDIWFSCLSLSRVIILRHRTMEHRMTKPCTNFMNYEANLARNRMKYAFLFPLILPHITVNVNVALLPLLSSYEVVILGFLCLRNVERNTSISALEIALQLPRNILMLATIMQLSNWINPINIDDTSRPL